MSCAAFLAGTPGALRGPAPLGRPGAALAAKATAQRFRIQPLIARLVEKLGEGVVRVRAQGEAECDPRTGFVAGGPSLH
ncbi:hypothetical protein AMK22_28300 [Streptomyces sp. CB01580]|nr:hypothetical protein AMK22_28300 [Streptomyces sp. CB01580]